MLMFGLLFAVFTIVSASYKVTEQCQPDKCKLPFCRCADIPVPGGYEPKAIPQMVVIAFDDSVNYDNWETYNRLFPPDGSRTNPNGCPIAATFFVTDAYTDYCMVSKLYARGMEIGVHSVTHRLPILWWESATAEEFSQEMVTQRSNIALLAKIPLDDINGWRSPFIQPGGDNLFEALYLNGFTYDATLMQAVKDESGRKMNWPFTLDYPYSQGCHVSNCPNNTYPGFWIIPVGSIQGHPGKELCAYVDSCLKVTTNQQEASELLWKNFKYKYEGNRSILYLNLHSTWLQKDFNLAALDQFILDLTSMNDVFLVTMSKSLEWVKRPQPLSNIHYYAPWRCSKRANKSISNNNCKFMFNISNSKNVTQSLINFWTIFALSFVFFLTFSRLKIFKRLLRVR